MPLVQAVLLSQDLLAAYPQIMEIFGVVRRYQLQREFCVLHLEKARRASDPGQTVIMSPALTEQIMEHFGRALSAAHYGD